DVLIAPSVCIQQRRSPFFAQTERLAVLRSGRNANHGTALDRRNLDFCAKSRFGNSDRNRAMNVVAHAPEKRVRGDVCHHKEIAGRTAERSGVAFSGESNPRSRAHARRNFDLHRFIPGDTAVSAALPAVRDLSSGTAALGTGHRELQQTPGNRSLADSCTAHTDAVSRTGHAAIAFAGSAGRFSQHADACLHASDGIVKPQRDLVLEILATLLLAT